MADKRRRYDVDELAFLGRANVENVKNKTHGDHVVALVEGTLDQFVDVSRKESGLAIVGKVTTGEILVLTGEEADDAKERLAVLRDKRTDGVHPDQERIEMPRDKYQAMSAKALKDEAKARGLSQAGSKSDLVQRLLDSEDLGT